MGLHDFEVAKIVYDVFSEAHKGHNIQWVRAKSIFILVCVTCDPKLKKAIFESLEKIRLA